MKYKFWTKLKIIFKKITHTFIAKDKYNPLTGGKYIEYEIEIV